LLIALPPPMALLMIGTSVCSFRFHKSIPPRPSAVANSAGCVGHQRASLI
jgi:hypothetical protein